MDYEFTRGDTFPFPDAFKFVDDKGEVLTLKDTDKVYMTARTNANSKEKLFQKTLGNGITIGEDGYCYIVLEPDDTAKLPYGTYGFDISLKTASGLVTTPIKGSITLTEEYTHKEDEI